MYGVIYKITNKINGKAYIGQTTRSPKLRFKEHSRSSYPLGNAIRKYGMDNFTLDILDTAENSIELDKLECFYIGLHNTLIDAKGYNLRIGGDSSTFSIETKKRMSDSQKKPVINVDTNTVYDSSIDAEIAVSGKITGCIGRVCSGKRKTYKGHRWEFYIQPSHKTV